MTFAHSALLNAGAPCAVGSYGQVARPFARDCQNRAVPVTTEPPAASVLGGQHAEDGESTGSATRPPDRSPASISGGVRWPSRPIRCTVDWSHARTRRDSFRKGTAMKKHSTVA